MRAQDGNITSLPLAGTSDPFQLVGGDYLFTGTATWGGGSAQLEMLGPDRATWISVTHLGSPTLNASALTRFGGIAPGTYRWTTTTATVAFLGISRGPKE